MNRRLLSGPNDMLPDHGKDRCLRSWQIGRQNVAMRPWNRAVQGYTDHVAVVDWVGAR
jgi:hypothetical protein